MITYKGITMCLVDWCKKLQLSARTIKSRLNNCKWSVEKAFTTPIKASNHSVINRAKNKQGQAYKILSLLMSGSLITKEIAIQPPINCYQLPKRIAHLRKKGYNIKTIIEGAGKRETKKISYFLINTEQCDLD